MNQTSETLHDGSGVMVRRRRDAERQANQEEQLSEKSVQKASDAECSRESSENTGASALPRENRTLGREEADAGGNKESGGSSHMQGIQNAQNLSLKPTQVYQELNAGITPCDQLNDSSQPIVPAKDRRENHAQDKGATKLQVRELPKRLRDWKEEDYKYFATLLNNANSKADIRRVLPGFRNEKIAQICLKVQLKGIPIPMEKVDSWFLEGGNSRSPSRLVKVCGDGDYIRISRAQAARFGLELRRGKEYEFEVRERDGKQVMILTPLA